MYGRSFKSVAWGGTGGRSNYCYELGWMLGCRWLFGVTGSPRGVWRVDAAYQSTPFYAQFLTLKKTNDEQQHDYLWRLVVRLQFFQPNILLYSPFMAPLTLASYQYMDLINHSPPKTKCFNYSVMHVFMFLEGRYIITGSTRVRKEWKTSQRKH